MGYVWQPLVGARQMLERAKVALPERFGKRQS